MKTRYLILLAATSLLAEQSQVATVSDSNSRLFDPFSVKESYNLYAIADLLVWQASQSGLDYAVKSEGSSSHIASPDFDWRAGVRVGLGVKIRRDQWDLAAIYTHMDAKATDHTHGDLSPLWQAPFASPSGGVAESAMAHYRAFLNVGDLELGRNCIPTKWLSIRPFIGVRGLVLDQAYHISYAGGSAVPAGEDDLVHLQNDYWGVGMRIGFNSLWGFGKGFSIYGNGAFSALSGNFDVRETEKLSPSHVRKLDVEDDHSDVVPVGELALGIQWDHFFAQERYHLGIKLGWEFNMLFNQNQLVRFLSPTDLGSFTRNGGDFSLQGATLGLRFDF